MAPTLAVKELFAGQFSGGSKIGLQAFDWKIMLGTIRSFVIFAQETENFLLKKLWEESTYNVDIISIRPLLHEVG